MTSTLLIGVFLLVLGWLLIFLSVYGMIKMGLWKKVRNWYATKTQFDEWMETNHPSLEYEYNTRFLEWNRNTNKQKWRLWTVGIATFIAFIGTIFDWEYLFPVFETGVIVGICACVAIWIFQAWARVGVLEDERKGPELKE